MKPIPRTSISKNLPFPNGEKKFGMHVIDNLTISKVK